MSRLSMGAIIDGIFCRINGGFLVPKRVPVISRYVPEPGTRKRRRLRSKRLYGTYHIYYGKMLLGTGENSLLRDWDLNLDRRSIPEKLPRSRLVPYYELIDALRRRGCTYREIERILADQCQFQISRSAINNFMRSHSRRRAKPSRQQASAPVDKKPMAHAKAADSSPKKDTASQNNRAKDEVFQRIAALKKQPTAVSSKSKLFHYDPNEPLRIEREPGKENPGE